MPTVDVVIQPELFAAVAALGLGGARRAPLASRGRPHREADSPTAAAAVREAVAGGDPRHVAHDGRAEGGANSGKE